MGARQHPQALRRRPGRASSGTAPQLHQLLAERTPFAGLRGRLQAGRAREQGLGQGRCVRRLARQVDGSIGELGTVATLELVGRVLERLDRHQSNAEVAIAVAENALRFVEERRDPFRLRDRRRHRLREHCDRPPELLR